MQPDFKVSMRMLQRSGKPAAFLFAMGLIMACNLSLRSESTRPAETAAVSTPRATPQKQDTYAGTAEPVLDATAVPPERILPPTVDEVLAECPTVQEIAEVDSKIQMSFEADPTAGTLSCTAAAGSADFTREQKNAYNAVLIMKHLKFDAPLPWTNQSLYDWFTGTIVGIRFRSDIVAHSCCGTPPTIDIKANLHAFYSDRWTAVGGLMRLYVHEARHTYMAHQCDGKDTHITDLGAYGVEARLYEWLAYHSDPDFLAMLAPGPTIDYRESARHDLFIMQRYMFCLDPTPSGPPPVLTPSPLAGTQMWTEPMIRASRSGVPVPTLLTPEADAEVSYQGAVFSWEPMYFAGGVTYGIEIDAMYRFEGYWEFWQARADAAGIAAPRFEMPIDFDGTYSPMGRWRVWAISPAKGAGPKSEWRYFRIGK